MPLHYSHPHIVLEEVPNEISLALSISGCPLRCKGCHSQFTYLPTYGDPLTPQQMLRLLQKHPHITCVLFYGGEWNPTELITIFQAIPRKYLLALYTGLEYDQVPSQLLQYLDYLKTGPYIEALGGLQNKQTNQVLHTKKFHTEEII